MKLRSIAASIVVCSLMTVSQAFAHTTIFGSTGMVINPTAGFVPVGQTFVQASYLREKPAGLRVRGLNVSGARSIAPGCELSLGWNDVDVSGFLNGNGTPGNGLESRALRRFQSTPALGFDTSGISVGGKYRLRTETETMPAVAVGVQYVNLLKQRTFYIAISKDLTQQACEGVRQDRVVGVRGHFGARWDSIDSLRSVTGRDESELTFYGGVEAELSPRVSFMGEIGTRHDALVRSPLSATVHYDLRENTTIFGGVSRVGITRDTGWIVGFSYAFGRAE